MHVDDRAHGGGVRETDVMEEAAAQERVRQLLLVVTGDENDRTMTRLDELTRLVDIELHPIQLAQQIVRELDVGLVDLVDEQHRTDFRLERLPEASFQNVVADVMHASIAQLRVTQA